MQKFAAAPEQWAAAVQLVRHVVPPESQTYAPQDWGVDATQPPWPLHAKSVRLEPTQLDVLQPGVPFAANLHAAAPSHPNAQPASPTHSLSGSLPDGIGLHVPSLPASLHELHLPAHAESQHTPSAQVRPDTHCPVEEQPWPLVRRGRQLPPPQYALPTHWASEVHEVRQVPEAQSKLFGHCEGTRAQLPLLQTGMFLKPGVALQVAAPHDVSSGRLSTHSPPAPHSLHAPQLATLQQTPSVQSLLAQASFLLPQAAPKGRLETHFPETHWAPPLQSPAVVAHWVLQLPIALHW
jgi:hypothetical protein